MDRTHLITLLNKALAEEYCAVNSYISYAAELTGNLRASLYEDFIDESKDEMKHAEFLVNKIVALGAEPTRVPSPIKPVNCNATIISALCDSEEFAVRLYTTIVKVCDYLNETALKVKIEEILVDEQKHYEDLMKLKKEYEDQSPKPAPNTSTYDRIMGVSTSAY